MANILVWVIVPIIIIALYFLHCGTIAFFLSLGFLIYVILKFVRSKASNDESLVGSVLNSAGDRRLNAIINKYTQPDKDGKCGIDYVTCMGKSDIKISPKVRAELRTLSVFLKLDNKELKREIKDILDERGVQPRQLSGKEARTQAIKTVAKGMVNEDYLKDNLSDTIKVNSFKNKGSKNLVQDFLKDNYDEETVNEIEKEKNNEEHEREDFDYNFAKSYRTFSKKLGDWEYNPLVKKEILDVDESLEESELGEDDESVNRVFSFY